MKFPRIFQARALFVLIVTSFSPHLDFHKILCSTLTNFVCVEVYNADLHTAILRKVAGKSERHNPGMFCGWFLVHCSSNKLERMARQATDICLRVLKESNKRRFDSYSR